MHLHARHGEWTLETQAASHTAREESDNSRNHLPGEAKERMLSYAYKHARLMAESESRVEMTAWPVTPVDVIAHRVLEHPESYRRWESEHDRIMRTVSQQARLPHQVAALRSAGFRLVHRRALFEYLRERHLTGAKRRHLFAIFYGCRDYTNAVLAEHGNYVRCSSSYLCTQHLAEHLMLDPALDEPLTLYEEWYTEYFNAFCDVELAETEEEKHAVITQESLKPLLKYRVTEGRKAILAMPPTQREWREVSIREPTGDTQVLKAISLFQKNCAATRAERARQIGTISVSSAAAWAAAASSRFRPGCRKDRSRHPRRRRLRV